MALAEQMKELASISKSCTQPNKLQMDVLSAYYEVYHGNLMKRQLALFWKHSGPRLDQMQLLNLANALNEYQSKLAIYMADVRI